MKIVCPCCGETIETDLDVVVGQHVICPACDQKFTYGRGTEDPALDTKAEEAFVQKNAITTNCPHCGTEYEADRSDFGRFVACEECGEGFVIGQTGDRVDKGSDKEQGKMRQAVALVGAFGNAVSEEIGRVNWRRHWNQAQQTAENTAKTVKGKLDEIDWERHGKQAKDAARDGAALGRKGLQKAQVAARTFWQNWLAAPSVVKVVCCLLMAKGIGAFCNLYHMSDLFGGGIVGLPALIINVTFTAMGAMVWGELISAVSFLFVFPYGLLQKRRWVGKAGGLTFLLTQLTYFVVMISSLGFDARLMRQVLFSWENVCLIAALIMMFKFKSIREWLGLGLSEEDSSARISVLAQTKRLLIGSLILLGLCVAGAIAFSIASDHESRRLKSAIYAASDGVMRCRGRFNRESCSLVPIESVSCEKDKDCGFDDIWNVTLRGNCSKHGITCEYKRFRFVNGCAEQIGR